MTETPAVVGAEGMVGGIDGVGGVDGIAAAMSGDAGTLVGARGDGSSLPQAAHKQRAPRPIQRFLNIAHLLGVFRGAALARRMPKRSKLGAPRRQRAGLSWKQRCSTAARAYG